MVQKSWVHTPAMCKTLWKNRQICPQDFFHQPGSVWKKQTQLKRQFLPAETQLRNLRYGYRIWLKSIFSTSKLLQSFTLHYLHLKKLLCHFESICLKPLINSIWVITFMDKFKKKNNTLSHQPPISTLSGAPRRVAKISKAHGSMTCTWVLLSSTHRKTWSWVLL